MKFIKWLLVISTIIFIPIIITIIVLYSNDMFLLKKFETWIHEPGNLTAFIAACIAYLPIVTSIWRIGLLISASSRETIERKKIKQRSFKCIYDDGKDNSIYYDAENDKINLTFKSPKKVDLKELIDMIFAETKARTVDFIKNEKKK